MAEKTIQVQGIDIRVRIVRETEYVCLTDMVRSQSDEPDQIIKRWLRNKNTIEFLGVWEQLYNPSFNPVEFDWIKNEAGVNRFSLSPKEWIKQTNAIGIESKTGRYGSGTYAHLDIATELGAWISPQIKWLLIMEFRRLKEEESQRLGGSWDLSVQRLSLTHETQPIS